MKINKITFLKIVISNTLQNNSLEDSKLYQEFFIDTLEIQGNQTILKVNIKKELYNYLTTFLNYYKQNEPEELDNIHYLISEILFNDEQWSDTYNLIDRLNLDYIAYLDISYILPNGTELKLKDILVLI